MDSIITVDAPDLLPDSRLRETKGAVNRAGVWWVPVFCANCGVPYGYVPEENCTFACWLCEKCEPTYGPVAGVMLMPDEVFWQKVQQEQLDRYGRLLTEQELLQVQDEAATPLGTLLKQGV